MNECFQTELKPDNRGDGRRPVPLPLLKRESKSEWLFTANESYEHHNDCEHKQEMQKSSERVRRNEAEKPQNEKYRCNRIQHAHY